MTRLYIADTPKVETCEECHGSGKRLGTYGDIECPDCEGLGQWNSYEEDDQ